MWIYEAAATARLLDVQNRSSPDVASSATGRGLAPQCTEPGRSESTRDYGHRHLEPPAGTIHDTTYVKYALSVTVPHAGNTPHLLVVVPLWKEETSQGGGSKEWRPLS